MSNSLAPDPCDIMIDRGQLENALLNLVVNARDAMPDGGVLTVSTGKAVLPGGVEGLGADVTPGEYAMLCVADTGTGMPPAIIQRIFEPFFTTKKFGEGSGLGLSMVYGFVSQSGGHIFVDSTVGVGSTFRIYLPRGVAASGSDHTETHAEPPWHSDRSGRGQEPGADVRDERTAQAR